MHGQFVWYELTTPDVDAAIKFYPRFTNWGTQKFDENYTMFTTGGLPIDRPTGQALKCRVVTDRADERANRDQPVHHLGHQGEVLADLDPRHARIDRLEFAANFRGSVHLQIEHVLMRRATWQENHDNCFVGFADTGLRLGS